MFAFLFLEKNKDGDDSSSGNAESNGGDYDNEAYTISEGDTVTRSEEDFSPAPSLP